MVLNNFLYVTNKRFYFRSFTSICYSADGEYILAGGQSKNVCIYNVKESMLVKKFEITQNRSFDAVDVGYHRSYTLIADKQYFRIL